MQQSQNPQNALFQVVDRVPAQVWYTLGIVSIILSAIFQLTGRKNWADFVGKWPPTFLAVGLYHKLVRPGSEDVTGQFQQIGQNLR
jgi:purine-cytosine permease-like protein